MFCEGDRQPCVPPRGVRGRAAGGRRARPLVPSLRCGRLASPRARWDVGAIGWGRCGRGCLNALGNLAVSVNAPAALLAAGAPSRLRGTLLGAIVPRLASAGQARSSPFPAMPSLLALSSFVSQWILPVATVIDSGALACLAQLARCGDLGLALRATHVLLDSLMASKDADVRPVLDTLRPVLLFAFRPTAAPSRLMSLEGPL